MMIGTLRSHPEVSALASCSSATGFNIEVTNGSGMPAVAITTPLFSDTYNHGQLQTMLATGTPAFSTNLQGLLDAQGLDALQFAFMLQGMIQP